MKSRMRTIRVGATALAIGALTAGALVLTTAAGAEAAPVTAKAASTTTATAVSPHVCRYGCL
jgi:hypothetical protein